MDISSAANSWVDAYLEALISAGSRESLAARTGTLPDAVDADRAPVAKYYLHQVLALDEEALRRSWTKVAAANRDTPEERDARIEYLSWRVWAMKRKKAALAAAAARRAAAAAAAGEDEYIGDYDDSDDRTVPLTHPMLYMDDLDANALEPLTEEADHDPSSLLLEPLSGDQASVPDTDTAVDQSWDAVYPATAAAKAAAKEAAAKEAAGGGGQQVGRRTSTGSGSGGGSPFHKPATPSQTDVASALDDARGPVPAPSVKPAPSSPLSALSTPAAAAAGATPSVASAPAGAAPSVASASSAASPLAPPTEADLDLLLGRPGLPRLYVVLISLHGLVRGTKMELGRDPDTGGQVKYVVELARALGRIPSVARVDLLTRLVADPKVDASYSVPEERLALGPEPAGGSGSLHAQMQGQAQDGSSPEADDPTGAFIVRLPCGPPEVYLKKEDLWPHVREFADRTLAHVRRTLGRLAGAGQLAELWAVHGHYADAGEAAALVAQTLGCPMLMTGHSLGRNKKAHLLSSGSVSVAEVEATYRISRRIEAEERALDCAAVVFTSTQQEVKEQWGLYDGYPEQLAAALTTRPLAGHHVPAMVVIPPGLDFSALKVQLPPDPLDQLLAQHQQQQLLQLGSSQQFALPPRRSTAGGGGTSTTGAVMGSSGDNSRRNSGGGATAEAEAEASRTLTLAPSGIDAAAPTAAAAVAAESKAESKAAAGGEATAVEVDLDPTASSAAAQEGDGTEMVLVKARNGSECPSTPTPSLANDSQLDEQTATCILTTIGSPIGNGVNGSAKQLDSPTAATPPLKALKPIRTPSPTTTPAPNGATAAPQTTSARPTPTATPQRSPRTSTGGGGGGNGGGGPAHGLTSPFSQPTTPTRRALNHSLIAASNAAGTAIANGNDADGAVATVGGSAGGVPPSPPLLPPPSGSGTVFGASHATFTTPPIWKEVRRFLRNPAKPVVLAMSRPDAKKNVAALVRAYGSSPVLRELANLVLVLGNRDSIDGMAPGSARVMQEVLRLVDAYDMYGSVAYPKRHAQSDISDIYHLAAATRGVFVNVALQEPFGLTLIEAAAHGVPIVATCHGGPVDIVATLRNGVTVEPADVKGIATAITSIITSPDTWDTYSNNGRNNILAYSWPSHVMGYLRAVEARKQQLGGGGGGPGGGAVGGSGGGGGAGGPGPLMSMGSPPPQLRASFSLSFDDLSNLTRAVGDKGLPALGEALCNLAAGRTASLPFELSSLAAGFGGADTAAVAAAAADLLRGSSDLQAAAAFPGGSDEGVGGDGAARCRRRSSHSFDASDSAAGELTAQLQQLAAVAAAGGGDAAAAQPVPELIPRARLCLQDRLLRCGGAAAPSSSPGGGARWLVFCCDSASDVQRAAGIMAGVAAASRAKRRGGAGSLGPEASAVLAHAAGGEAEAAGSLLGPGLGLGLVSCLGCKDTRQLLSARGASANHLDFLVCNNACQVWVTGVKQPSQSGASSPPPSTGSCPSQLQLLFDEVYERHIEHHWEPHVAKQVVRRILSNRSGWGRLPLGRAGHPAPRIHALGPYHIMVSFVGPAAAGVDPALLLSRFRRKLRLSGLRAQVTAAPLVAPPPPAGSTATASAAAPPSDGSASIAAYPNDCVAARAGSSGVDGSVSGAVSGGGGFTVHVVPLRCSRPLVLRYLSVRFGVELEAVTLVAFRAAAASSGSGQRQQQQQVVMRCSDAEELVGGVPRVVLLPEAEQQPQQLQGPGKGAVAFPVDLEPFADSRRVAVL